jgi:hypothetical protein
MTYRRLITLALVSLLLAACSPGQNGGNTTPSGSQTGADPGAPSEMERRAAEQKLARMQEAKRQSQAQQEEQQRIIEEKAAAAAAAAATAAQRARYDPVRLQIAGKWRQWADITIPDLNIHAWLKTSWKDNIMHLRLALLGDKTALRLFTGNWKYFRLVFADQGGNNLHQAILETRDLHWDASGLRNAGVPTMEFEGDSEITLEIYESIVQWNLKWDNDVE